MKKLIATLLSSVLFIATASSVTSYASVDKYDIAIGNVEDEPQASFKSSQNKNYNLDFSCLDVKFKDGKMISEINQNKIDKVSKSKNLSTEKEKRLLKNAEDAKNLIESELNDKDIHKEIYKIIQQNLEKTSQMPVISMVEATLDVEEINKATAIEDSINPFTAGNGPTESNKYVRLYTSVSGITTNLWAQSNVYRYDSTLGNKDAISITWNSPWLISNTYDITFIDIAGGDCTDSIAHSRVGSSNTGLAYSFPPEDIISGVYLGAKLVNGTKGGHNIFSEYIASDMSLSYSYSLSGGSSGISVSPTLGTTSLASSIYFSL